MSEQMKSTCTIYILYSRQGQSLVDQDLMKFLNLVNIPQCLFDQEQCPIFQVLNVCLTEYSNG